MKVQAKAGQNFLSLEGGKAGEGLAIFLSQDADSEVRWHFEVYAKTDADTLLVGEFETSTPNATTPPGKPTRQVASVVCPGATTWDVIVSPSLGSQNSPNEVANVILASSKCCTAPVGVTRVGERYGYHSEDATSSSAFFSVLAGQTITSIGAIGAAGGGTIILGDVGTTIVVPAGISVNLEPKAPIPPSTLGGLLAFTNVLFTIEFLESG